MWDEIGKWSEDLKGWAMACITLIIIILLVCFTVLTHREIRADEMEACLKEHPPRECVVIQLAAGDIEKIAQ